MIKLNFKSKDIHRVMSERFNMDYDTSVKAWLLRLSVMWREADDALHDKECSSFIFSRLELVLADMILLCIATLHHLGVRNIENLLRRRLDENDRNNKIKELMK